MILENFYGNEKNVSILAHFIISEFMISNI